MGYCKWEPEAESGRTLKCKYCSYRTSKAVVRKCTRDKNRKWSSTIEASDWLCVHRGDMTRVVTVPGCSARQQEKIYACAIHGECAMRPVRRPERLIGCLLCDERKIP